MCYHVKLGKSYLIGRLPTPNPNSAFLPHMYSEHFLDVLGFSFQMDFV